MAEPRFEAIVLAAGAGGRFGGDKLLAPWRGGVLLDGALDAAFAAPVERVILVVAPDSDEIAEAARRRATADEEVNRLQVVIAADAASGLSASLLAGIASLDGDADAAFVFLGDMPLIPHHTAARLAEALEPALVAAAPLYDGRRGHPVLLSRALLPMIETLAGDRGFGALLDAQAERVALVRVDDPGVLLDVDTPADLLALDAARV